MANMKSIRIGKELHYELLLVFDRFKGLKVKAIYEKIERNRPGYASLKTLYNYHRRYRRAEDKCRELTKGW